MLTQKIFETNRHSFRLHLKQCTVLGYSYGSIVVAKLLVLDADRIVSGVLGGVGDAFTDRQWQQRYGIDTIAAAFEKRARGETVDLSNTDHPQWGGPPAPNKNVAQFLLQMAAVQRHQPVTTLRELGTVKAPVLVINGEHDIDNGEKHTLAAMMPNSKLVTVKGDHMTAQMDPNFNKVVLGHLRRAQAAE